MAIAPANLSSKAYWNTPRRGFIQDGKFTQYPEKHGGSARGETDAEFKARLALFDAGVQRFSEPEKVEEV
jgi:hypothetical protein